MSWPKYGADHRAEEIINVAKKYDFKNPLQQTVYGVFYYCMQPCCYSCHLITQNKERAEQALKVLIRDKDGNSDYNDFIIKSDTVENLMESFTRVPTPCYSSHFTFPVFKDKFESFLTNQKNDCDVPIPDPEYIAQFKDLIDEMESCELYQNREVETILDSIVEKLEELKEFVIK